MYVQKKRKMDVLWVVLRKFESVYTESATVKKSLKCFTNEENAEQWINSWATSAIKKMQGSEENAKVSTINEL